MGKDETSRAPRDDFVEMPAPRHAEPRNDVPAGARPAPAAGCYERRPVPAALGGAGFPPRVRCADNVSCSFRCRGTAGLEAREREPHQLGARSDRRRRACSARHPRAASTVSAAAARDGRRVRRRVDQVDVAGRGVGRISATAAATGGEAVPIWLTSGETSTERPVASPIPCCVATGSNGVIACRERTGHNDGHGASAIRACACCSTGQGSGRHGPVPPRPARPRRPKARSLRRPGGQRPGGAAGATDACTAGTDTAFPPPEREAGLRSPPPTPSSQAPPGRPARRLTRSSQHGGTAGVVTVATGLATDVVTAGSANGGRDGHSDGRRRDRRVATVAVTTGVVTDTVGQRHRGPERRRQARLQAPRPRRPAGEHEQSKQVRSLPVARSSSSPNLLGSAVISSTIIFTASGRFETETALAEVDRRGSLAVSKAAGAMSHREPSLIRPDEPPDPPPQALFPFQTDQKR